MLVTWPGFNWPKFDWVRQLKYALSWPFLAPPLLTVAMELQNAAAFDLCPNVYRTSIVKLHLKRPFGRPIIGELLCSLLKSLIPRRV